MKNNPYSSMTLDQQIGEWCNVWHRIFQNQPEILSLVKDTPVPLQVCPSEGLSLENQFKEVNA